MPIQLSLLWTWHRTIDRVPYLVTGAILFCVKFVIDWLIATYGFGQSWSPLNYLIWPNDRVLRVFELGGPERLFSLTMLLVSLPFIWCGVILTLHRLRSAGLPLGLVLFFFVPLVNLLLFLILMLLPTRRVAVGERTFSLHNFKLPSDSLDTRDTGIIAPSFVPPHQNLWVRFGPRIKPAA